MGGSSRRQPSKVLWDRKLYQRMVNNQDKGIRRAQEDNDHLAGVMRACHVLRSMPDAARLLLARRAQIVVKDHMQHIFSRGDVADASYVVLAGEVDLIVPDATDSRLDMRLSRVSAGHSIGDLALIRPDAPRVHHAIATLGPFPKGKPPVLLLQTTHSDYRIIVDALEALCLVDALALPPSSRSDEDLDIISKGVVERLTCFRGVPAESRRVVSEAMELVHLDRGETVFAEADPANSIYVSVSANIEVTVAAAPDPDLAPTPSLRTPSRTPGPGMTPEGGASPSGSLIGSGAHSRTASISSSVRTPRPLPMELVLPESHADNLSSSPGMSPRKLGGAVASTRFTRRRSSVSAGYVPELRPSGSVASIHPGESFGERCLDPDRKTRGETARVLEGGLLVRVARNKVLSSVTRVADKAMTDKMAALRKALNVSESIPLEQLHKLQMCFSQVEREPGSVLGRQGKAVDTLFVSSKGASVGHVEMHLSACFKRQHPTPRSIGGSGTTPDGGGVVVGLAVPDRTSVRSLVVATAGPGECVGLVDHFYGEGLWGEGLWTATYTTAEAVTLWQAPTQRVLQLLSAIPGTIQTCRAVAARACQLRASRLQSALAMIGEQGLEASQADLDLVAKMANGGRKPSKRQAVVEKAVQEEMSVKAGVGLGKQKTQEARKGTEALIGDPLFKGTALAKKHALHLPEKELASSLLPHSTKPSKSRLETLSVPLRKNPFSPRRTEFEPNLTHGAMRYPPGCWLSPRTSRSKDNWVEPGLLRTDPKDPSKIRNIFAESAEAKVRAEREASSRLRQHAPQTTIAAKGMFGILDTSSYKVALTPHMERTMLHNKVAESVSASRWHGLSFMPRTGRRPMSRDYVLESTLENGRMRHTRAERPLKQSEVGAERLRLSGSIQTGTELEVLGDD